MKSIREMRERMGEIYGQIETITKEAETRNEPLTQEELSTISSLRDEYENLEGNIDALEAKRRMHLANAGQKVGQSEQREVQKIRRRFNFGKLLASQIPGGERNIALDGVEREMHQEAVREMRSVGKDIQGIGIPSTLFTDKLDLRSEKTYESLDRMGLLQQRSTSQTVTLQTATAGDEGGVTVQTDVMQIIEDLWPRTFLSQIGATMLTGLTSNVQYPVETQPPVATWKGEITALDKSQKLFEARTLTPHRLGTYIEVSKQLIIQSVQTPSITSFVTQNIQRAITQALEAAVVNGSGTGGEPTGILTDTGVTTITGGGDAPTWADVIALETAVADANGDFGSLAYLTNALTRGALKQAAIDAGSGLFTWFPQGMAGDYPSGGMGLMNGYPAYTTTNVPKNGGVGTNESAIIFGNWDMCVVGQWGGMDILVNPYVKDIEGLVRITANTYWDHLLLRPETFAVVKDVLSPAPA